MGISPRRNQFNLKPATESPEISLQSRQPRRDSDGLQDIKPIIRLQTLHTAQPHTQGNVKLFHAFKLHQKPIGEHAQHLPDPVNENALRMQTRNGQRPDPSKGGIELHLLVS